MKNKFKIHFVLCLFSFILSCNGQKKEEQSKVVTPQSNQTEANQSDFDPYFTEGMAVKTPNGPNSITRNIIQDKKGNFWFATWEGIIHYDGKSFTNMTNKEGLKRFRVFTVLEDRKGNIWFGTVGAGVYHFDGELFTNITTKQGLVNDRVGCLLEDKNGDIWIGTAGGVSKYNGNSFTNFTTKEGLSNNDVNTIVEDKSGKLWFGTRGGTCNFDGQKFTKFNNQEGRPFINVRSIIEDKKGNIWLGGNDGLWSYDGNSLANFTKNFVGYIYQDRKENIWTSSASNGNSQNWILTRYDTKSLQNKKAIATQIKSETGMLFGILEASDGSIWFGSLNGVYRYDGHTINDFKAFTIKG